MVGRADRGEIGHHKDISIAGEEGKGEGRGSRGGEGEGRVKGG